MASTFTERREEEELVAGDNDDTGADVAPSMKLEHLAQGHRSRHKTLSEPAKWYFLFSIFWLGIGLGTAEYCSLRAVWSTSPSKAPSIHSSLGLVYLDHAGATLYSELKMEAIFKDLSTSVYGNPHRARGKDNKAVIATSVITVIVSIVIFAYLAWKCLAKA